MRKVIRPEKPKSLAENAEFWTEALLSEIKRVGDYSKVSDSFKNKYHQDDIKESLSQFFSQTYEWNNLHWSCEICNTSYKRAKWNESNPILDPSKDDIPLFLALDFATGEYYAIDNNERALTTIHDAGLNRKKLVTARRKLMIRICINYRRWRQCGDGEKDITELMKDCEDFDFPSVFHMVAKELLTT